MKFFNYMKNDIVTGKCVDMSVDGLGIAKADNLVVFVKDMIKGETAQIRITKEKKNYAYGIIEKMIEASEHRIISDCPVAYKCGGCDYRHIDYDYQLKLKKEVLENTLKGFHVEDIIPDDDPYYYRNKIQIPVRDGKMGFYRSYSNDIVEFDDCLIESELANRIIKDLKKDVKDIEELRHIVIKHAKGTDEVMLGFVVKSFDVDLEDIVRNITARYPQISSVIMNLNDKDTNVILGEKEKLLYGNSYIHDIYDGITVKISLKSFYQVNHRQMLKLYDLVRRLSGVNDQMNVLDLYCGIGTISLYMARYAKSVEGVEIVKEAVDNARDNAKLNNIDNTHFILADASKDMDRYIVNKDLVIVDPPRKGISKQLIDSLIANNVPNIVYVSCNPATLARDLKMLEKEYDISHIYPVDMFPFTTHVETVVLLSKVEKSTKKIHVDFSLEDMDLSGLKEGASYEEIKAYVKKNYGFQVSSLNIAQTKEKYGIKERKNYNLPKKDNPKQPRCTEEKEEAILDAFKHFNMV